MAPDLRPLYLSYLQQPHGHAALDTCSARGGSQLVISLRSPAALPRMPPDPILRARALHPQLLLAGSRQPPVRRPRSGTAGFGTGRRRHCGSIPPAKMLHTLCTECAARGCWARRDEVGEMESVSRCKKMKGRRTVSHLQKCIMLQRSSRPSMRQRLCAREHKIRPSATAACWR